jgi:hypothetical protein
MKARTRTRRTVRLLVLTLTIGAASAVVTAPTLSASAATCQTQWGSLAKKSAPFTGKQVVNVRSGRHACFDRLVVDINGDGPGTPGYQVSYVGTVRKDGSGQVVPLRGGAKLLVVVNAPAYDDSGQTTYRPARERNIVDVTGYRTFRQVAWANSFEGQTSIGLGVRARLPMRTFVLSGPDGGHRVVVDVAHRW